MLERRPACMTRPLSQDLRDRVIAVVDGGLSCNAAAERFGIAVSSGVRWVRAWRDVILAAIEAEVDITLVELAALLRSQYGASFAPSTVWRFLDRHDLTFKKNSARQRAGAARRRCPASGLVRRAA